MKKDSVKKLTINVLGMRHEVIIRTFDQADKSLVEFGEVDISTGKIYINALHPPDRQIKTLIHEVLEVINEALELGLKHAQITQIETGMFTSIDGIGKFIDVVYSRDT